MHIRAINFRGSGKTEMYMNARELRQQDTKIEKGAMHATVRGVLTVKI
jgi:hypothetical protein